MLSCHLPWSKAAAVCSSDRGVVVLILMCHSWSGWGLLGPRKWEPYGQAGCSGHQQQQQQQTNKQIKLGWALFVTCTIIQSIMRSEMCSLHLTHPSVHTWSSGQPTVQRPGSSRGLPVGARIRTHNLGLPRVSSPTLYPLGQRLPKYIVWQVWSVKNAWK